MKPRGTSLLGLGLLIGALGCATAQPLVVSNEQRSHFEEVVRAAETAGALDGPPEAAKHLADAKSDFDYAQHIPRYPERARDLLAKAQAEGDLALELARQHRSDLAGNNLAVDNPAGDNPRTASK